MIKRESAFKSIQWKRPVSGSGPLSVVAMGPGGATAASLRDAIAVVGRPEVQGDSTLEKTIHLLRAAAEVEHQLLVEYLYAAYSLAQTPPPTSGVSGQQLSDWRRTIIGVAKEEMGHLLTVQNLLLFLGAQPHLGRISPASEGHAPFPFKLEPLSLISLAKYVSAESPDRKTLDAATLQRAQPAYDLAQNNNIDVKAVGLIYAQLYFFFQSGSAPEGPWNLSNLPLDGEHLVDADFKPLSIKFQGSSGDWSANASLPVSALGVFVAQLQSRADALQALHDISTQGEGISGPTGLSSHFMRFLDMFQNIPRDPANQDQLFPGLIRLFPVDPVYGPGSIANPPDSRITDPVSAQWCGLLDLQYHLLLAEISLSVTLDDTEANGARGYLTSFAVMNEMVGNVAPIANTIASLPKTPGVPAAIASAAPTFSEIDFPSDKSKKELARWAKELVDASNFHVQGMLATHIVPNRAGVFPAPGRTTSNADLDSNVLQPVLALP